MHTAHSEYRLELPLGEVDLGWTPGAHQSRFTTPLLLWTETKYNKGLMG